MKTKIIFRTHIANLICLMLLTPIVAGYAQMCPGNQIAITIENMRTPSSKVIEFDVFVKNTGTTALSLAAMQGAVTYDKLMLPENATVTFIAIETPNATGSLSKFSPMTIKHSVDTHQLRWFQNPVALSSGNTVNLPTNEKIKFGSFRLTSSQEVKTELMAKMKPQLNPKFGYTTMMATVYCNGNTNSVALRPSPTTEGITMTINGFNAVAFPNPFTDEFHFELESGSENPINVKVYDMLGKLVDQKIIEQNEIETTALGTKYPAGVYNVIVSQGTTTQTLRIIKR